MKRLDSFKCSKFVLSEAEKNTIAFNAYESKSTILR